MEKRGYRYLYGPVPSWRLGSSLGIDPISGQGKACTFDCVYCQLGRTDVLTGERKAFVSVADIIEELDTLPALRIDTLTFSGRGEPTLAKNLGEMIRAIKKVRKDRVTVLTNSSLLGRKDVQQDLAAADRVVAKLDAASEKVFAAIDRPVDGVTFDMVLQGIKDFRGVYPGRLDLQMMFTEDNKGEAARMAALARSIRPDEVQINTPLRPCGAGPLSETDLGIIEAHFAGLKTACVYRAPKRDVASISGEDTLRRRGKI